MNRHQEERHNCVKRITGSQRLQKSWIDRSHQPVDGQRVQGGQVAEAGCNGEGPAVGKKGKSGSQRTESEEASNISLAQSVRLTRRAKRPVVVRGPRPKSTREGEGHGFAWRGTRCSGRSRTGVYSGIA